VSDYLKARQKKYRHDDIEWDGADLWINKKKVALMKGRYSLRSLKFFLDSLYAD
jgi:hypothetical protein